ncbi:hypothetical protein BCR36DRAFT_365548 [Piromyces finnis]|uniref:Uncharacterized protein n=1 Tax=Piromyces finnis TaxID=1754191 RepID=A0A1Y1VNW0_9FUNG|nr:hypothetical protein BCR36DRAFT_365548 [Piromyces finnis]|eukprot:ORX60960.1 hypothetical protein BCR36DRAFT_365548 [Piromyces finnis]
MYTSRMKWFLNCLFLAVTLNFVFNLFIYGNMVNELPLMQINIQGYWLSSTLALKARLTSIAFMGRNEELYNSIAPLNEYINNEFNELIVENLIDLSSTDPLSKDSLLYGKTNNTMDSIIKSDIFDLINYLSSINSVINEIENNKEKFKTIFENSMDSIIKKIEQKCLYQKILALVMLLFIFAEFVYLIFFVLIPIIKYTISTEARSLTMFGKIPKACIDEMIKKYESQIRFLSENFDEDDLDDDNNNNNNNEENNKVTVKKDLTIINDNELTSFTSQHPTFWSYTYLIFGLIIILIPLFIIYIPVLSFKPRLMNNMNYQINTAKKGYYINQIILYSYEQFFNDEYSFIKYETKRKLNEYLTLLEENDKELFENYNKASVHSYDKITHISNEQGCVRKSSYENECLERVYNSTYGYTKEIADVPYNLKMNEYLAVVKRFIRDMNDFSPEGNFFNENDLYYQINNAINNKFIKYQKSLKDDLFGTIYRINELFLSFMYSFINKCVVQTFITYIIALIAMIICYKFLFIKVKLTKEKELEFLSFFIFIVPQFYIKNNESYQRFIETGKVDED